MKVGIVIGITSDSVTMHLLEESQTSLSVWSSGLVERHFESVTIMLLMEMYSGLMKMQSFEVRLTGFRSTNSGVVETQVVMVVLVD